jgi:hypothetical protein
MDGHSLGAMPPREVLVEQRLRTTGLAAVLALALALCLNVGVVMANTTDGHALPALAVFIGVLVLLMLLTFFLLALRIVVRVVDGPRGPSLEVAYGPGGLVRQVFGPQRIVSATTHDVSFAQSGGWGYRGNLRLLRRASLVTRRGDALQLDLVGGRRFIVTVDDPVSFATALRFPLESPSA